MRDCKHLQSIKAKGINFKSLKKLKRIGGTNSSLMLGRVREGPDSVTQKDALKEFKK
jgi:hypothetical protein